MHVFLNYFFENLIKTYQHSTQKHAKLLQVLSFKAPIITVADEKLCVIFPNSRKNKEWYFMRVVCQQTIFMKLSKGAKIRNQYNQVPHLTQDTNGKARNSQLDTTNERQEVSHFLAGDHKAQINRRTQRHNKHKTEKNKT